MLVFSTVLFFLTTFLAAGLIVLVAWFALQKVQPKTLPAEPSAEDVPRLLREEQLSSISLWNKILERYDFIDIMTRQIGQADLNWSVGRVTLAMLLSGTIALAVLVKGGWFPGWIDAGLAYGCSLLPYMYILRRRSRRFARIEAQFPDALDSLARALRAGHPFAAAMEIVSSECDPPLSIELRRAAVEGNFGTSWAQALENLSARVPLLEVSMFSAAVQLQGRTGGKLSEVLATLAETMREAYSLKGEVKALAAHGRVTGVVLTVLPIFIAIAMTLVNPSYLAILINNPYGKYLFGGAVASLIAAHFVIRKIVDIRL